VARVTAGGDPVISQGFTDLRDLIIDLGSGDEQARYGTRHRLPDILGQSKFKKWHSNGYSGLKARLDPLDAESILRILNISLAELAMNLGLTRCYQIKTGKCKYLSYFLIFKIK
jgi:hypothetical protein